MADGRLQLRRGVVVAEEPLTIEVGGERRAAWADTALLGEMREGDEVLVNVAAVELGLGSGGFDVVHANLTRGLDGGGAEPVDSEPGQKGDAPHVMKLNYTSLQHPVDPVEPAPPAEARSLSRDGAEKDARSLRGVLVLPLHGHLAPAVWAAVGGPREAAKAGDGLRVGYVQTGGGALPGSMSRDVAELLERGLLDGHVTAAPAYGGGDEAMSVVGALDAAAGELGWDAALVGPGPGIIGSETRYGHGGMAALDSAHAALSLGLRTVLSPRLSGADPRERHRGVSHHTRAVLDLLLAAVDVAIPAPGGALPTPGDMLPAGLDVPRAELEEACGGRHALVEAPADLAAYAETGLPARSMGRSLEEDPLFYAAPLAAGAALRGKG